MAGGSWAGVVQEFQRGTIMVGSGPFRNSRAVFIKANGWTIWWTGLGLTELPTIKGANSADRLPATWQHGGELLQINEDGPKVTLLQCPQARIYSGDKGDCLDLLPDVYKPGGSYDPAARLNRDKLTICPAQPQISTKEATLYLLTGCPAIPYRRETPGKPDLREP